MWFIADRIARMPAFTALPFYQFGGYASERLMVCVFHSAFVSVALWRLRRGFVLGVAGAVALHWLGNFPLSLMAWNVGGLGKPVWMIIVQLFLIFYLVGAISLLVCFAFARLDIGRALYGRRLCPECAQSYDGSLWALNFGPLRYERCPHCRRWHWTKTQKG
jgi:hypothetical protein